MSSPSSADPRFWDIRYVARQTPWDLGRVPAALERFLARQESRGGHVLVPGCGTGHEIPAFVAAGYRVTALDFSPAALTQVQRRHGRLPGVTFICGDFFTAPLSPATFDLIYERTFLCALPLERRSELVAQSAHWLRPGGLLAGLYFYGAKEDGPPFGLTPSEAGDLFSPHFTLIADESVPAAETLPLFAGYERWQVRQRRTLS